MIKHLLLFCFFINFSAFAETSERQILSESRQLAEAGSYLNALEILDLGLTLYPESHELLIEFRRTSELFIVHEISQGYKQIDENPHNIEAYLRVSEAFMLAGDRFKALQILLKGTFENQKSPELWRAIGRLENSAGRFNESQSVFAEAQKYE